MATGLILLVGFTLPGHLIAKIRPQQAILALILSEWLVHLAGMAIFTLVLAWDMERRKRENKSKLRAKAAAHKNLNQASAFPYVIVASFSLAYALLIEIIQIFIPSRTFDLKDLFFDALGIAIVLAGIYFLKEKPGKLLGRYL